MKKIRIKFRDLFDMYSTSTEVDKIHSPTKKLYVKDPNGELVPIRGLIKKSNIEMSVMSTRRGIKRRMASGHLIKCTSGFHKVNDLTAQSDVLVYNDDTDKIKSISDDGKDFAYDISIDAPHEYITPDGLIHHNTTLSRIIVDSLIQNESDSLILNGSDSTGVESMRTTVMGFLKSPPYQAKFKIVYIDEFDYTTSNAQAVLRNMMETYASNGRFIVTGNYWSKVIEPIQSRFTLFEMSTVPKDFVIKYAKTILDSEKITYDDNSVDLIVSSLLPDVRKIINTLQKNTSGKKLKKIDVNTIISNEKKICGQLIHIAESMGQENQKETINRNVPQIMELLNTDSDPDFHHIYQILFFHANLPAWAKIKVNEYMNGHSSSVNPSIHFMAMVYDIIQSGMSFFNMFGKK